MHVPETTTAVELGADFAPNLHDGPKHLVVAVPCEQNLSRVQFVQCASDGPHINGVIIGQPEDDFRGAVEPTD